MRGRVDQVVENKPTANALKPWYPGWCKRPCFHDEYLQAFNKTNVHLIDTAGAGVSQLTANGFVVDGMETPADMFIFSTGFEPFRAGTPAARADIKITGCGGLSLDEKLRTSVGTLHGVFSRDFSNLILSGTAGQAAGIVNVVHTLDTVATHAAHIVAAATQKNKSRS